MTIRKQLERQVIRDRHSGALKGPIMLFLPIENKMKTVKCYIFNQKGPLIGKPRH